MIKQKTGIHNGVFKLFTLPMVFLHHQFIRASHYKKTTTVGVWPAKLRETSLTLTQVKTVNLKSHVVHTHRPSLHQYPTYRARDQVSCGSRCGNQTVWENMRQSQVQLSRLEKIYIQEKVNIN